MNFYIVSIFPEVYKWWKDVSLIGKAQERGLINFKFFNPRDFCEDKHKQIDDEIYWWWKGMLLKAKPFIDTVEYIIKNYNLKKFKIIYLSPSKNILNKKKIEQKYIKYDNYILVCGRYEGIDYRFEQYLKDKYPKRFERLSIWKYILMGWELASMVFIESLIRFVPWVIKEQDSILFESYSTKKNMKNIEYPQYTRPYDVYWYKVPDVLLSWNHKLIKKRREENEIL